VQSIALPTPSPTTHPKLTNPAVQRGLSAIAELLVVVVIDDDNDAIVLHVCIVQISVA